MRYPLINKTLLILNTSSICGLNLLLVSEFKDIDEMFVSRFNFTNCTEIINNKVMLSVRLIKRTYRSYIDPEASKKLYWSSLVCLNLEYSHFICIDNTSVQDEAIQSVQNNLLLSISFKFNVLGLVHGLC